MRFVLRSKIHKAIVTEANINYLGSITVDEALIEKAGFWIWEKVLVVSNTSGARLETYVIAGRRNSGIICMNGASSLLIKKDEEVIIMGFELTDRPIKPTNILVDKINNFVKFL
ncbi:MAG: aspartate 1-decarboxylase [Candidatus Levybacteria bacterium]|nr:aspartate 1-decarboxylase [Candidatus Levybacteria bacterium]